MLKIDVFSHVLPPRYLAERNKRAGARLATQYGKYFHANPGLTDLDVRFRARLRRLTDSRLLAAAIGLLALAVSLPVSTMEVVLLSSAAWIVLFVGHETWRCRRPHPDIVHLDLHVC